MQKLEIQECKMELAYQLDEPMHMHQDIEIMYLVNNEVRVQTDTSFVMKENDIMIFNSGEEHALRCKPGVIVFHLFIPYRLAGRLSTDEVLYFQCNSALHASDNSGNLVQLVERLVLNYLNPDFSDLSEIASLLFRIIHELFENCRVDPKLAGKKLRSYQGGIIDRILNYINLHYYENLSLPKLAELFNMSETYLSRLFKDKVGQNYVTYLNDIRIQNAVLDLRQTDKSMTAIALDCGFSTPSVFNRHFKNTFGKTPSEYRKEVSEADGNMEIDEDKSKEIQQQISTKLELELNKSIKQKEIKLDAGQIAGKWSNKNTIINIGEAAAVCDASIQRQIIQLKQELGITYVRIWTLFSEKFMITNDFDGDSYNFFYLDNVLDFFVHNGISLYLDLGQRKRVIIATSKRKLHSEEEKNQPVNAKQWENLLNHFISHLKRRYGKTVLEQWIFEFPWNLEPYYTESYDYVDAYRIGRNIVKKHIKNARVAGLSPNLTVSGEQFRDAVKRLREEDIFPEIVSIRVFIDLEHRIMDDVAYNMANALHYARQFVERVEKIVRDEHVECEFCISEWSNKMSNRNLIQDSCARGTDIVRFVSVMNIMVDIMGFWHGLDAIDVFYDTRKLIYGGGGILTKDGIKKPSFYAFEFLKQLGGELLNIGDHHIITKDSSGAIICLCYNRIEYSYYYYIQDVTEQKDLAKYFKNGERVILELEFSNLEQDGRYLVSEEVVNNDNGSVQDEWQNLGNQEELGKAEIQYLKNICIPRIHKKQLICADGKLSFHIEMEPHEMRLIHIDPLYNL